jgi:hypothetical protein
MSARAAPRKRGPSNPGVGKYREAGVYLMPAFAGMTA